MDGGWGMGMERGMRKSGGKRVLCSFMRGCPVMHLTPVVSPPFSNDVLRPLRFESG